MWRKENNRDSCAFLPHDTQSDEVSLRTLVLVVIHRAHVSVVDQIYAQRRHTMARTCIDKRMNGEKINKQRHALRSPFKVVKCILNDKKKDMNGLTVSLSVYARGRGKNKQKHDFQILLKWKKTL